MTEVVGGRQSAINIKWMKTPGHRRPALWAAVLLAGGIILARHVQVLPYLWGIILFLALICLLTFARKQRTIFFLTALVLWITLGAFRYAAETQVLPANHISHHLGTSRTVEIFGRVVDLPDRRQRATNLVLSLRYLKQDGRKTLLTGRILVRVSDTAKHFSFGDFLRFTGRLEKPHVARNPGSFDYRQHLLNRGIYGVAYVAKDRHVRVYPDPRGADFFNRLVIPLREYILATFRQYLPGISGTLLAGYLIGETRDMPDWLYEAYRRSGTLHLLAVSGSNVWLVLGLFWLVFRWLHLPRLLQTVLLLSILIVFCFITRNEPSVVRAGLMAALVLLGRLFYRRIDVLNILGVSAVIILLFSPRHLFLAGFQLSYAALLGIVVIAPRILQLLPRIARSRWWRWPLGIAGSSVAATAATAPVMAAHFGMIPVISVAANLVMVPLAGLTTNCALVLVLLGDLWPAAARVAAWAADLPATWSIDCARYFEAVPLGLVYWPRPGAFGMANFILIVAAAVTSRYWYRWLKPAVFYALLVVGVFMTAKAVSDPPEYGEVMFLDAGRHPLVSLRLPGHKPSLLGTAGAFSPPNHQWVIEPYAMRSGRHREDFDYDTLPPLGGDVISDFSVDSVSAMEVSACSRQGVTRHVRLRRWSEADQKNRTVADYLTCGEGTILIVYRRNPELLDYIIRSFRPRRIDVLAVPATLPSTRLIEILRDFNFGELILFGTYPRLTTDAVRQSWARLLPEHQVFSTRKNGGIKVELSSIPGAVPTIP